MSVTTEANLESLREEIDRIDRSLVELLAVRYRTVEEVARLKTRLGMMRLDPRREADVVRRAAVEARRMEIPEEGVREVVWAVIGLCRRGSAT